MCCSFGHSSSEVIAHSMSFPVTLHIRDRLALVAGGGDAARKKASAVLAAGARLRIVAPVISDELRALSGNHGVQLKDRTYEAADLDGVFLAFAATSDDVVNRAIVEDCRRRGILVCDTSAPERGDFSTSATVQIGDVTFAIDTGGSAPAFAKRLADELRLHFGESYAAAARTLGRMRSYIKAEFPKADRAELLRHLASLPVEELASRNVEAVVCATRGSALAMIQARSVAAKLARRGIATTFLNVTTKGDRVLDRSIAQVGGENIFVKELETAMREGRAHYAVHSCKDLGSTLPPDMQIAAISAREDPRDVFCSERFPSFHGLPPGARVGTSSSRRRAQLSALRSDLLYLDLRGNVDTRLRKLHDGDYDAIVLAAAGLRRLGLSATHTVPFETDEIVPAAGQGSLAVEVRAGEGLLQRDLYAAVNDRTAELAIRCERSALAELRGGCQAPIGVFARVENGQMAATGAVAAEDGSRMIRAQVQGPSSTVAEAEVLGKQLAAALAGQGALELLRASAKEP